MRYCAVGAGMMEWLRGLKTSLIQWSVFTIIASIGVLLVLLRYRTLELHRAKMALLQAEIDNEIKQDEAKVASAREAYERALKEYEDSL